MAQQAQLNTLDDSLAFAKQLIKEQETEYQLYFAAGNFNEIMAAKRELAKQRNIFGRLLKEKMGRWHGANTTRARSVVRIDSPRDKHIARWRLHQATRAWFIRSGNLRIRRQDDRQLS